MQKFLTFFLLLCTLSCFSQSEYDLFESYNSEFLKKQNSKIKSVTGFRNLKGGLQKITSYKEFSAVGLPTKIVEYDENSNELRTVEFIYTSFGRPLLINTFKKDKKIATSEFYYDSSRSLHYYKDYVYSSLDGKKMLLWKTDYEYYSNKKVKAIIKMEVSDILPKRDTVEILYFDASGAKTKSYFDMAGYKQYTTYQWNQGKTEMKESEYSGDSIQSTTIHKYKGVYEIERSEIGSNKPLVFWKYDNQNRLSQTNASIIITQDLVYDVKGYLINESWTANFPELVKDNDSKIMRFTYEYKFRK
jgi:hypothetical protein